MLIRPVAMFQIAGRYDMVSVAPKAGRALVVSEHGKFTLLDEGLQTVRTFRTDGPLVNLTLSPDGETVAAFDARGRLVLLGPDGGPKFRERVPVWVPATRVPLPGEPTGIGKWWGEHDLAFSPDGKTLWCAGRAEGDRLRLLLRSAADGNVLNQLDFLPRDVGSEGFGLIPHPEGRVLAVRESTDPDHQWLYWVYEDGGALRVHFAEALCRVCPTFHPAGGEFLTKGPEGNTLGRYSFPDCALLAAAEWPSGDPYAEDGFGYRHCYLSDEHALIDSNEGRLFVLNLGTMSVGDELALEVPTQSNLPRPRVRYFQRLGPNRMLSVHAHCTFRRFLFRRTESWHSTILVWECPELLAPFPEPDPSAPYSARLVEAL